MSDREKWITISRSALGGKLPKLAYLLGAVDCEDQAYKMRPFLGESLRDAVNVEFNTKRELKRFQKIVLFIVGHGEQRYKDGVGYGGDLLQRLARAEITQDDFDYKIRSATFYAGLSVDRNEDVLDE